MQPLKMEIDIPKYQIDLKLVEDVTLRIADGNPGYRLMLLTELVEFERERGNFVEKTLRQQQREAQIKTRPEIIL
jgi:hypothetical protein